MVTDFGTLILLSLSLSELSFCFTLYGWILYRILNSSFVSNRETRYSLISSLFGDALEMMSPVVYHSLFCFLSDRLFMFCSILIVTISVFFQSLFFFIMSLGR